MYEARKFAAGIALSIWLLIFRVVGVACVIDGASKLGWLPASPTSQSVDDFQPSPLGSLSAVIEIVAGLFVTVGLRFRTACLVLAGHLGLGLLVTWLHNLPPFAVPNWGVNTFLLSVLLALGPGRFSVDYLWPDALSRLVRRRPEPPSSP